MGFYATTATTESPGRGTRTRRGACRFATCRNDPVNNSDALGLLYLRPSLQLTAGGIVVGGIVAWGQVGIYSYGIFGLTGEAKLAERRGNDRVIALLQEVVSSSGETQWPEELIVGGRFGVKLTPQGGVSRQRQAVRNLFENAINAQGWWSAMCERVSSIWIVGFSDDAFPKEILPGERLVLARAYLARALAYREFLLSIQ